MTQNVLKSDLKKSRICPMPFGANLTTPENPCEKVPHLLVVVFAFCRRPARLGYLLGIVLSRFTFHYLPRRPACCTGVGDERIALLIALKCSSSPLSLAPLSPFNTLSPVPSVSLKFYLTQTLTSFEREDTSGGNCPYLLLTGQDGARWGGGLQGYHID